MGNTRDSKFQCCEDLIKVLDCAKKILNEMTTRSRYAVDKTIIITVAVLSQWSVMCVSVWSETGDEIATIIVSIIPLFEQKRLLAFDIGYEFNTIWY